MPEETNQKIVAKDYLDTLNKSQGSNRDTEGLGAMAIAGGGLIIGSVDAINGQDGTEVQFPVTTHELRALAEYWWTERIDHDFWFFLHQQTGSSEWRRSVYIGRRLDRLHGILGKEAMGKARDRAAARVRKIRTISDETWKIFTEGRREEQDAWREKFAGDEEAVTQPEGKALAEAFGAENTAKNERQVGIARDSDPAAVITPKRHRREHDRIPAVHLEQEERDAR